MPQVPSRIDITAARARVAPHLRRTPILEYGPLWLKLEQLQHTGSFKPRGAFNTVLTALEDGKPPQRLVAASGGNHGLAVAHVGRALGLPTQIFVPTVSSPVKISAIRALGADLVVGGASYVEAAEAARAAATAHTLSIHPYDAPGTVIGQGTLAAELADQLPDLDTVVVAVGGGGLMAGIAAWYGRAVNIIAVEPTTCPTLHRALAAGNPVAVEVGGVAADALGAQRIGDVALAAAEQAGVRSVLVSDDDIMAARQELWDRARVVAEPAGATALAAVASGAYRPADDERVAVIVCGGNTDPSDLSSPSRQD